MRRMGFTLIELVIVIFIIGLLIGFILKAAMGGIRRAEEKATIALVAKLEQAMSDRVEALSRQQVVPTEAHRMMAAVYNSGVPKRLESPQRAQVIARLDAMRAALPDVFCVIYSSAPAAGRYPFNFAASAFGYSGTAKDYLLPLGANAGTVPPVGVYGASFEAAGGIYRQLGYCPEGYDGQDNNRDGYIDDILEGTSRLTAAETLTLRRRIVSHKHKTARSEMLYALLVEDFGPFGSVFERDDFTNKEVQDTDGDGLMEFVDAWGEPLQFYRWPILFRSDSQKGFPDLAKFTSDLAAGQTPGPYSGPFDTREVNPIDPNQTLLAPAWWGSDFNDSVPGELGTARGKISGAAITFMFHFFTLVDPLAASGKVASNATYWDRSSGIDSGYYLRRAYYSRFLILSAGPDRIPGVAQLGVNYRVLDDRAYFPLPNGTLSSARDSSGAVVPIVATFLIQIENQGGCIDPNRVGSYLSVPFSASNSYRNDTSTFLEYLSEDDITNHSLYAVGGPLR